MNKIKHHELSLLYYIRKLKDYDKENPNFGNDLYDKIDSIIRELSMYKLSIIKQILIDDDARLYNYFTTLFNQTLESKEREFLNSILKTDPRIPDRDI